MKNHRRFPGLIFVILGALSWQAHPDHISLPPLNQASSDTYLPGKFVWADLFSAEIDNAKAFYQQLFGWQWQSVDRDHYSVAYADGQAVAGLMRRPQQAGETIRARWIHYASTGDVPAAVQAVEKRGGRTIISPQSVAERGDYAVVEDWQGSLFGLIRSASGDPGDYQVPPGYWIWMQLSTPDVTGAAEFYSALLGYEVFDQPETGQNNDEKILVSAGYARAGVTRTADTSQSNRSAWLAFVRVSDIHASVARVREIGGDVLLEPPPDEPDANVAIIRSPSGESIGLLEWHYPEEQQ